jgi:transcriptional regulator GlxA family with amidase domain
MFFDAAILRLAELMALECDPAKPLDTPYGDSLSQALLIALGRPGPAKSEGRRQRMAAWQLKRTLEYIESHLDQRVSVGALAELAQLSRSHFIRAFKASLGATPLQCLRDARIRRAQRLLLDRDIPLAQIAADTGFADQAHLTRIFHRVTGESPGAWRHARLGPGS